MRPVTHRFDATVPHTEPGRAGVRPSGVLMGSLRRAVSASLLAASLTTLSAACGHQHPAAGAHPSQSVGGVTPPATPRSGRIDTGLVSFMSTAGSVPEVHTVLRSRGELTAFAGRFGKRGSEIAAKAGHVDFSRTALVGWSTLTGCAQWPSATLHRSGDRLTLVAARHPEPPPECFAPFHVIAVFEVARERLPSHPHFAD
ncbi:hypothetical protein [Streptomyces sp. NPDC005336]|uniref:hypothetical protein n=1 Tax=unclassified Streptomyces TaxID=2593676 RepID=UPI0033AE568A